ncbi:MAG TPA: ABC transporter permease subunit, partial [Candidatus Thermoplasmatota archaeon]|nr:ABC transporter permease subunit [Candidatus Thermoplasmatota archaeon]
MKPRELALLALPLLVLGAFFAWPLARTLSAAFAGGGAWDWLLGSPFVRARVGVAVLQALLSVALTLALAAPLAWLHHRRALPWGRWQLALHAAPFAMPVFVVVFGLQALLGPRGVLADVVGIDLLGGLGALGAVVVAHAYYNYGFAARLLHATLERRPHRLEEAAQALGASPRAAFLRVTLPLLAPTLVAIALLVFLFSFTSFGVVLFLGEGQVSTLETLLYENMGGAFPAWDRAAALGSLQLAINLALLACYMGLRRREARLPREPARAPLPARARDRALAALLAGLAVLPLLLVLAGGFRVRGAWTLEAWRALLDPAHAAHLGGFDLGRAVGFSLLYASLSTLAAVTLTLLLAYGLRSLGGRARRVVEAAAALPLGTSSLLLGLGFALAFGAGAWLDLRGQPALVVAAHTIVAFPFVARVLLPALDQHDRRLDEAAALLGAPPSHVVARVHWPLLRAPLLAAAGFAAAISLGDFGASLVLMRPDAMSLSIWI